MTTPDLEIRNEGTDLERSTRSTFLTVNSNYPSAGQGDITDNDNIYYVSGGLGDLTATIDQYKNVNGVFPSGGLGTL